MFFLQKVNSSHWERFHFVSTHHASLVIVKAYIHEILHASSNDKRNLYFWNMNYTLHINFDKYLLK